MYALTTWTLGTEGRMEIDRARYLALKEGEEVQRAALSLEEMLDLVLGNYEDLEKEIFAIALLNSARHISTRSKMFDARLQLNRRIINLLSTCKLYIDHVQRSVRSPVFAGFSLEEIKGLFSRQYDTSLGYRVMEALRNYAQHRNLPIRRMRLPGHIEKGDGYDPLWAYNVALALDLDTLGEDAKFKSKILEELRSISDEENDILLFVRQYVEGIGKVHGSLRDLLSENVEAADRSIEAALEDWANAGHGTLALVAARMRSASEADELTYIASEARRARGKESGSSESLKMLRDGRAFAQSLSEVSEARAAMSSSIHRRLRGQQTGNKTPKTDGCAARLARRYTTRIHLKGGLRVPVIGEGNSENE